ncbi:hypothetical protein NQ318_013623 [Aromia moschata]|uniref:Uncharacterized protein n=1 Tax=Aromia moschata TaxID=1265417 RepID=A0AAV8YM24_9CUCU|nr:hypothetical protein NQ318_013623 [Aromia moschata]
MTPTTMRRTAFVPKVINENQKRPSVLVCVQGGKSKEISSDEIQGAMALVELKNGPTFTTTLLAVFHLTANT